MSKLSLVLATEAQKKYLDGLFIDCGFATHTQRAGLIKSRTSRGVSYNDELTKTEASVLIELLKEMKEEKCSNS